jgi:hypothetical protein
MSILKARNRIRNYNVNQNRPIHSMPCLTAGPWITSTGQNHAHPTTNLRMHEKHVSSNWPPLRRSLESFWVAGDEEMVVARFRETVSARFRSMSVCRVGRSTGHGSERRLVVIDDLQVSMKICPRHRPKYNLPIWHRKTEGKPWKSPNSQLASFVRLCYLI